MTHLALDLGLRTTGVAWHDGSDTHVCPTMLRGGERLSWWDWTFAAIFLPFTDTGTVVVEAPILHAINRTGSIEVAKLHGVCELAAYRAGLTYVTVTPAELKKAATGSGAATKGDMVKAAQGRGWSGRSQDEADAFCLWWAYQEGAVE